MNGTPVPTLVLLLLLRLPSATQHIPLLGVFLESEWQEELVFRLTVDKVNRELLHHNRLEALVHRVSSFDSFNITNTVCEMAESGLGGVVAGGTPALASLADRIAVPLLQTHWVPASPPANYTVNLHPDPTLLAKGLGEVVSSLEWPRMAVLYEDEQALLRLGHVLGASTTSRHPPFTLWQLGHHHDQRSLLKEISNSSEYRVVLDCRVERLESILHQAKEVRLLTDDHSYFLTNLDGVGEGVQKDLVGRANITAVRLFDPSSFLVQATVQDWLYFQPRLAAPLQRHHLTTGAALVYDAVMLFGRAVHSLERPVMPAPISCHHSPSHYTQWSLGYDIINIIKQMRMDGMTGRIEVHPVTGRRSDFSLDLVEVGGESRTIGSWRPHSGPVNLTRTKSQIDKETYQAISNKFFKVASKLGEPYLRQREGEGLEGNERYEGFSLDLIQDIANQLSFKFEFYIVEDGEYGSLDKDTKQWNGLIRDLRDRKADLAVCDLTITYDRRSAVDFTMPFMNLGISILYSKPPRQAPSFFKFLKPFSFEVWMCLATALLSISLAMYILSRCSPFEWENPHPCNPETRVLECPFSLQNCLWFAIGTLMQQGGDISPKAFSTRLVTGFWGFFVLLMISSYTANLAAFLTSERMDSAINNVQDLAKQSRIKYGVVQSGSTANFFRESNDSMYQKMWSAMESARPSVFVKDNKEGVERVLKGKRTYAFFMESTSIEYQMEQHCELTQIGGTLDSKGYGIAMPFQYPYRTAISGAVLNMQESGRLDALKKKWWKHKDGRPSCSSGEGKRPSNEMSLASAGGVFLVLIIGCFVAFSFSIMEFLWNVRKVAVHLMISPWEALVLEMWSTFRYMGTTKPVRRPGDLSLDHANQTPPLNYIEHINSFR